MSDATYDHKHPIGDPCSWCENVANGLTFHPVAGWMTPEENMAYFKPELDALIAMAGSIQPRRLQALIAHPVVQQVARRFGWFGWELYLVGGSVRDLYSTGGFDDLDFATNAPPDDISAIVTGLGPVWDAGRNFGTIGVVVDGQKVEITTYRADKYDRESRKPEVAFAKTIQEDLERRDFTINAMAIDVVDAHGKLLDPYGGMGDLLNGFLRTPLDPKITILDDPLRALRAIRFAATRDLIIAAELEAAIKRNAYALDIVSQERKTAELLKIAGYGAVALSKASGIARELGVHNELFGPLYIERMTNYDPDLDPIATLAFASHYTPYEFIDLESLRLPSADIKRMKVIQKVAFDIMSGVTTPAARRLIRRNPDDVILPAIKIANHYSRTLAGPDAFQKVYAEDAEWVRYPLLVDGNSFINAGIKPGPAIGRALDAVETDYLINGPSGFYTLLTIGIKAAGEVEP